MDTFKVFQLYENKRKIKQKRLGQSSEDTKQDHNDSAVFEGYQEPILQCRTDGLPDKQFHLVLKYHSKWKIQDLCKLLHQSHYLIILLEIIVLEIWNTNTFSIVHFV